MYSVSLFVKQNLMRLDSSFPSPPIDLSKYRTTSVSAMRNYINTEFIVPKSPCRGSSGRGGVLESRKMDTCGRIARTSRACASRRKEGEGEKEGKKGRELGSRSHGIRACVRASSAVLPAATIVYLNVQKPGVPDYLGGREREERGLPRARVPRGRVFRRIVIDGVLQQFYTLD